MMTTEILDRVPFRIDAPTVFESLRLDPEGEYAGEVRALIEAARPVARPRAVYMEAFIEGKGSDSVRIGSVEFVSRVLRANLAEVERVFPYIATCGPELDRIPIAPDDFMGLFCRDTIKEMALRAAAEFLHARVCARFGLSKTASMSPGSGDADVWPIRQQQELFALFGDVQGMIGVTLTASCLMVPNKSVSGIYYPSQVDFVTCQLCRRKVCANRRAAFDPHLWQERTGAASD